MISISLVLAIHAIEIPFYSSPASLTETQDKYCVERSDMHFTLAQGPYKGGRPWSDTIKEVTRPVAVTPLSWFLCIGFE